MHFLMIFGGKDRSIVDDIYICLAGFSLLCNL